MDNVTVWWEYTQVYFCIEAHISIKGNSILLNIVSNLSDHTYYSRQYSIKEILDNPPLWIFSYRIPFVYSHIYYEIFFIILFSSFFSGVFFFYHLELFFLNYVFEKICQCAVQKTLKQKKAHPYKYKLMWLWMFKKHVLVYVFFFTLLFSIVSFSKKLII